MQAQVVAPPLMRTTCKREIEHSVARAKGGGHFGRVRRGRTKNVHGPSRPCAFLAHAMARERAYSLRGGEQPGPAC